MIIETERLSLREVNADDAAFILRLVNEPAWLRFIGDRGVRSLEAAQGHILSNYVEKYGRQGFGLWLAERKADRVSLGICGLIKRDSLEDIDLGFAFLSEFWGNGYAFEAATATVAYAKRVLNLDKIVAIFTPENESSRRLLEKLGFCYERKTRLADDAPEVVLYAASI